MMIVTVVPTVLQWLAK